MENHQNESPIPQTKKDISPAGQNPPEHDTPEQEQPARFSLVQAPAEENRQQIAGGSDNSEQTPPAQNPPVEKKQRNALFKAATILGNAVFVVMLLALGAIVFALVQSKLSGQPPAVAGNQVYIVYGGSMSPTFEAGSLAFIKPVDPQSIKEGDIITYRTRDDSDLMCTHRVVKVNQEGGQLSFTTRGDANDIDDAYAVLPGDIIGAVNFTVPYAGHLMDFAQTKNGLITLVFIPGILIIIFELRNLFKYSAQLEAEKKAKKEAQKLEQLNEGPGRLR